MNIKAQEFNGWSVAKVNRWANKIVFTIMMISFLVYLVLLACGTSILASSFIGFGTYCFLTIIILCLNPHSSF